MVLGIHRGSWNVSPWMKGSYCNTALFKKNTYMHKLEALTAQPKSDDTTLYMSECWTSCSEYNKQSNFNYNNVEHC